MKTLLALTLFLALAVLTLGWSQYVENQQIVSLQSQLTTLQTEVGVQRTALVSHKQAIVQLQTDDKKLRKFAIDVLEFFNQLEVIPAQPEKNSYANRL